MNKLAGFPKERWAFKNSEDKERFLAGKTVALRKVDRQHVGTRKHAGRPRGPKMVMRQFWFGEEVIAALDKIPKGERSFRVGQLIINEFNC